MVWVISDAVEYRCRDDRVCLVFVSQSHHRCCYLFAHGLSQDRIVFSYDVVSPDLLQFQSKLGEAQPCLFIKSILAARS
jgi:hypothetical protein